MGIFYYPILFLMFVYFCTSINSNIQYSKYYSTLRKSITVVDIEDFKKDENSCMKK